MKHRLDVNNLSRSPAHRKAMLRNLVISLFEYGRVKTTPQKAKSARRLAEKMITLAKKAALATDDKDKLHLRRQAISRLGSKSAVKRLFTHLGPRYLNRNGGYTRVIRLPGAIRLPSGDLGTRTTSNFRRVYGWRLGDGADQVYLSLVEEEISPRDRGGSKRRRGRKGRMGRPAAGTEQAAAESQDAQTEAAAEDDDAGESAAAQARAAEDQTQDGGAGEPEAAAEGDAGSADDADAETSGTDDAAEAEADTEPKAASDDTEASGS